MIITHWTLDYRDSLLKYLMNLEPWILNLESLWKSQNINPPSKLYSLYLYIYIYPNSQYKHSFIISLDYLSTCHETQNMNNNWCWNFKRPFFYFDLLLFVYKKYSLVDWFNAIVLVVVNNINYCSVRSSLFTTSTYSLDCHF